LQRHKQGAVFGTATKKEKIEDSPGPGNYEPLHSKIKTKSYEALILTNEKRHGYINEHSALSPGPGHYTDQGDARLLRSAGGRSRGVGFSQSKRENELDHKIAQSSRVPGPAEYTRVESTKKDAGPSFGGKRREQLNLNPGPGQYDTLAGEGLRRP